MISKLAIAVALLLETASLTNAMETIKSPNSENTTPSVVLLSIDGAGRWGLATAEILLRLESF